MTEPVPGEQRRTGITMLVLAWLVIMVLAVLGYDNWLETLFNPNAEVVSEIAASGARIVQLHANRQHQYVSSGTILDEPVVFIIDTGATDVVVPGELASRLQLRAQGDYVAQTANGNIRVQGTTLARLNIGAIELRNVPASINPAMSGREVLLGMSAMRTLEIRNADGIMTLIQR